MNIYFMRHGQTNYNIQVLCNDDPGKDVHLTEKGKQQAQLVAEKLKNKTIERIFVSELPRTRQTAEIVNQHHRAAISVNPLINDIKSGFESQPVSEYKNAIAKDPLHTRPGDGESLLEHKQRVLQFIDWLKTQDFKNILVVAHEETLRVITGYFKQLPDEDMIELAFDNCEYYQFTL